MILLRNVLIPVDKPLDNLTLIAAKKLKISAKEISSAEIFRRSVDVRKKSNPCFCCTLKIEFKNAKTKTYVLKNFNNSSEYKKSEYTCPLPKSVPKTRPVIAGSGPAGIFAALTLARAGIKPLIIERGSSVEKRALLVNNFWQNGCLNLNSNVQFGEGGAGTFSDGKLNTGIKDRRCRHVLETFHAFGADRDILINAKPHIGTDVLRNVVANMRDEIISLGGEYMFETTVLNPIIMDNKIVSVACRNNLNNKCFEIECGSLILAIGNAARDTVTSLLKNGVELVAKPFAVGVRIEHLQERINRAQYGENYSKNLPACEYKLAVHLPSGRGVYTFCMCPGGVVVNGASETGTIVTNGMSYRARNKLNANSALLVGINTDDFDNDPLKGIEFQRKIEQAAFNAFGTYNAPAQTVGSFLNTNTENIFTDVIPSIMPKAMPYDLNNILPDFICRSLREALELLNKKLPGFADPAAVLTAPETRSSAPYRFVRSEAYETTIKGVFACGEGSGYAGGITSSAVDGIRCAEQYILSVVNKG